MNSQRLVATIAAAALATALGATHGVRGAAGQNTPTLALGTSASLPGFLSATLLFLSADADKDGVVTRDELTAAGRQWLTAGAATNANSVTSEQLSAALDAAMPRSALAAVFNMGGGRAQPQTPHPVHVQAMLAALPAGAPARPLHPRRVLVLARAAGFVHSSIPLAASTIEALGTKTGAWSTTTSYDAADITADNLAQYDAVFLASTTGAFLDDPDNTAVTAARRQALLDFVRGGKGVAGIHAASDAYHEDKAPPAAGGGAASALGSFSAGATIAPVMMRQGDRNGDQRLDRTEIDALTSAWFETLDRTGTGRLTQPDFALFALMIPHPPGANAPPVPQGPDTHVGTWPDFNRMIGGYFKYHWLDPQKITVKIDDPASPLTAMFKGQSFDVHDEIYTMSTNSWSRDNVRVLTSIDYGKMSAADRALEEHPRADRDYGLSWIRREGQGRVFYQALGHSERIYTMTPLLEHLLAGMQYVLGDLKVDDTPALTYFPPPGAWARRAPAELGLDRVKLAEAIAFAEAHETTRAIDFSDQETTFGSLLGSMPTRRARTNGLVIYKGFVVAEFGDTTWVDPTYSAAKSMLASVAGIAVRDGRIADLDQPVAALVKDGGYDSPRNAEVTWRMHLQQESEWEGALWDKSHDFIGAAAFGAGERKPRTLQPPGTHYEYNDVRINRFALSLLRVFGKPVPGVFRDEVMDVIGASNAWKWVPYHNSYAEVDGRRMPSVSGGTRWGGGVWIHAWDMARFGYLWLRNGRWGDRQVLPPAYVREALTPSPHGPDYGYLWWLNTQGKNYPGLPANVYGARGAGSNTILISPDHDLVVVWRWHAGNEAEFARRVIAAIE